MSIQLNQVTKRFRDVTALDAVTLEFEEEKIYGLLGRNGAGKTTMMNTITNRIFPDSGEVLVDNIPAWENDSAQRRIYLMSEKTYYPDTMTVEEVFRWSREFYPQMNLEEAHGFAEEFKLNCKKRIKELSTGYQSIFKLAIALSVNAPYLLLDEPVLGLDANHRMLFYKKLITKYSTSPCTIVISTHLIEEVANVIEDVVIIRDGKIIRNESCEEMLKQGYTVSGNASAVDAYTKGCKVIGSDTLGGLKTAYVLGKPDRSGLPEGMEITKLDLQKLFIQLTGGEE